MSADSPDTDRRLHTYDEVEDALRKAVAEGPRECLQKNVDHEVEITVS